MGFFSRLFKGSDSPEELVRQLITTSVDDFQKSDDLIERLAEAGAPAIEPLIGALSRPGCPRASEVGEILRRIGGKALQTLLPLMNQDGAIRNHALEALIQFEEDGAAAIPIVTEVLREKNPEVRLLAARALFAIGENAKKEVGELLIPCTKDPDPQIRYTAITGLGFWRYSPERMLPIITDLALNGDSESRQTALHGIKEYGSLAKDSLPALIKCAQDSDPDIRGKAVEALAELGPAGEDALPELAKAISPDQPGSMKAAKAIWKVSRRTELVMPTVLAKLKTYDEKGSPEAACDLITQIGPAAREAVPKLITLLSCEDYDTLWATVDAIAAIGPDSVDAIPDLVRLLTHESGIVAGGAATALAKIGTDSLPELRKALNTGTSHSREFAVDALGQLGDVAEDAIPDLLELLDQDDAIHDASWVTVALAEIKPTNDTEMLDLLIRVLTEHPNNYLKARTAGALGKLGPHGRPALQALRKAVKASDSRVAEAARAAISAIESP